MSRTKDDLGLRSMKCELSTDDSGGCKLVVTARNGSIFMEKRYATAELGRTAMAAWSSYLGGIERCWDALFELWQSVTSLARAFAVCFAVERQAGKQRGKR